LRLLQLNNEAGVLDGLHVAPKSCWEPLHRPDVSFQLLKHHQQLIVMLRDLVKGVARKDSPRDVFELANPQDLVQLDALGFAHHKLFHEGEREAALDQSLEMLFLFNFLQQRPEGKNVLQGDLVIGLEDLLTQLPDLGL